MRRIGRGLRLASASVRVVAANPVLLLVLLAGIAAAIVVSGGLFLAVFHHWPADRDLSFPRELIALPVLWSGSVASSYCAVVVAVVADRRLRGETPRVSDGIAVANSRLHRIVAWTLLSIVVGTALQMIAERIKLGWLVSKLLGLAWGLATTFVVPVLAIEDLSVRDSIRRSATVFRTTWSETFVAEGTVGAAVGLAFIPAAGITVAVAVTAGTGAAIVVGLVLAGTLLLLSEALGAVAEVALYRYATEGTLPPGFLAADLDATFRPKHPSGDR